LARSSLAQVASDALKTERGLSPLETLRQFTQVLFSYVVENPGLPRLLFYDASDDEQQTFHKPLRSLVAMQRALVQQLIGAAQANGELESHFCPEQAAAIFISLIQGTLLQWQHSGRETNLLMMADEAVSLWIAGMCAREVRPLIEKESEPEENPPRTDQPVVAALDVRPILSSGEDPLEAILSSLRGLHGTGALELLAPFYPQPLIALLESSGHAISAEEAKPGIWRLWIRQVESESWFDLRDLESPEPLERVLEIAAELEAGDAFCALVPRVPTLLFPHLQKRGLNWQVQESFDECALLHVCRAE